MPRHSFPFIPFDLDTGILDPEADEVLLGLLARDNEPCFKPDKPHRRWVYPPSYWPERGWWEARAPDWWVFNSYAEYQAKNQEKWSEAERSRDAERTRREAERAAALERLYAQQDHQEVIRRAALRPYALTQDGWPGYWSFTFQIKQ